MLNATEYKERTARAAGMQEERYLIREGASPRSLLSGESVVGEKSGRLLTLRRDTCVEGVAGAGGIGLDDGRVLGGWCSFRCQLAVPRRFAEREGQRLVEGAQPEQIVSELMRKVLTKLFADVDLRAAAGDSQLKKQLSRRLQEEAARALIGAGWRITRCRLEKIQITRRECS